MRRMNYLPGLGLGRNQQGVSEFPHFPGSVDPYGLGYVPKENNPARKWCNRARAQAAGIKFRAGPMINEKEKLYPGEPEPFIDLETKVKYPGFEIFANDTWESVEEAAKIEELSEALD
ncbi:hypothetical protein RHMOL_Rhmol01G0145600 [Rhododendron molle]|uniref:Uncharacterized protein n=1 Tax=Rhododendron molle TaxID=49168 RepID=A0ACC0Q231_RHOML|nr:hypothetical protein RHMOL_Rhmol01G0145600 [Rhododendron molle]